MASKEELPDLMVKKLRYYARFILVCLLLRKIKLVNELLRVSFCVMYLLFLGIFKASRGIHRSV